MPYEIQLDGLPAGIALSSGRPGDRVAVQAEGVLSTEDGDAFFQFLDGISAEMLSRIRAEDPPRESGISHLVALIRRDRSCELYLNEVAFRGMVRTREDVAAGAPVHRHEIAELVSLVPEGVVIPDDVGVIVLLSAGWRKAIYFDLRPLLSDEAPPRDVGAILGPLWGYLALQDRVKLDDAAWQGVLSKGWFPFLGLSDRTLKALTGHARAGWDVDELVPEASRDARGLIPTLLKIIAARSDLREHAQTFGRALAHYLNADYVSAATMLYPRIEGVLRGRHRLVDAASKATQGRLAASVAHGRAEASLKFSPLLPARFKDYLETHYFASFDPNSVDGVSRHTVSHGIVPEHQLNEKAATLAVLTLYQIAFLLPPEVPSESPVEDQAGAERADHAKSPPTADEPMTTESMTTEEEGAIAGEDSGSETEISSIRTYRATVPDLFPPQHPWTTMMVRLAILRDDLKYEAELLGLRPDDGPNEVWRTVYAIRRLAVSIAEAGSIFEHDVAQLVLKDGEATRPELVALFRDLTKIFARARTRTRDIRDALGGHVRPRNAKTGTDGGDPLPAALGNLVAAEVRLTLDMETGRNTNLREFGLFAPNLIWADAVDDVAIEGRHGELQRELFDAIPNLMHAIDALLYLYWQVLGVEPVEVT